MSKEDPPFIPDADVSLSNLSEWEKIGCNLALIKLNDQGEAQSLSTAMF